MVFCYSSLNGPRETCSPTPADKFQERRNSTVSSRVPACSAPPSGGLSPGTPDTGGPRLSIFENARVTRREMHARGTVHSTKKVLHSREEKPLLPPSLHHELPSLSRLQGCGGETAHRCTAAALLWGDFFTHKVRSRREFSPGLSQCGETWSKRVRKPVDRGQ